MTTIAQLEMLLSTLPSDVVGSIYGYAKHPLAEIFKEAQSSGIILLTHPTLRRFPTAASLISECHQAFEEQDLVLFEQKRDDMYTWYWRASPKKFDSIDWRFILDALDSIEDMWEDLLVIYGR
jgi:hypothetical protein